MKTLTLRVPYPRLSVTHPEDEKSCFWGASPSAGGTLHPGHHWGEEGGATMAPSSPSGAGDLHVGVKWEGAIPWGVQQPRAHPGGYPRNDGCFVLGGRGEAPPPPLQFLPPGWGPAPSADAPLAGVGVPGGPTILPRTPGGNIAICFRGSGRLSETHRSAENLDWLLFRV